MSEVIFQARATRRPWHEDNVQTKCEREFDALELQPISMPDFPAAWPENVEVKVTVRLVSKPTVPQG